MKSTLIVFLCVIISSVFADDSNGLCVDKPDNYFVRDPKSCQKYYTCIKGTGVANSCPGDLQMDETNQYCGQPEDVKCSLGEENICKSSSDLDSIEIEGECDKFYLCIGGKPYEQSCAAGMWFDKESKHCDVIGKVNCNACPLKDDPMNPVYMPNKQDCSKYYICFNRAMIPFE